jgi:hypothetical protein
MKKRFEMIELQHFTVDRPPCGGDLPIALIAGVAPPNNVRGRPKASRLSGSAPASRVL